MEPVVPLEKNSHVEQEMSVELQVQNAVDAIDLTISTAEKERDLAMQVAVKERSKRMEAEAELSRIKQEQKMYNGAKAFLCPDLATELDSLFEELDNKVGTNLDFNHVDESINHEKIMSVGKAYVQRVQASFEELGDLSHLSDAEFVNARYRYIMDS